MDWSQLENRVGICGWNEVIALPHTFVSEQQTSCTPLRIQACQSLRILTPEFCISPA